MKRKYKVMPNRIGRHDGEPRFATVTQARVTTINFERFTTPQTMAMIRRRGNGSVVKGVTENVEFHTKLLGNAEEIFRGYELAPAIY